MTIEVGETNPNANRGPGGRNSFYLVSITALRLQPPPRDARLEADQEKRGMNEAWLTVGHEDRFVFSSTTKTGNLFDPAGVDRDGGRNQNLA